MTAKTLPLAGYVRVSSADAERRADEAYDSVEQQRRAILGWADAHDVKIDPDRIAVDEDVSGGLPASERKLGDLIADVEDGRVGGIVVRSLDRLGRSLIDLLMTAERIKAKGGRLVAVIDSIDTATSTGKIQIGVLGLLAEIQRDRYREDWAVAVRKTVEAGHHQGAVPYGYFRPMKPGPHGKDVIAGPLEVVDSEVEDVKAAFMWRAAGRSWNYLARGLTERTGEPWSRHRARNLIGSRSYLGWVTQGEIVNPEAHEAIIPPDLWQAAQLPKERPPWDGSLAAKGALTSLVICRGCGRPMGTNSTHGGRHTAYICKRSDCASRASVSLPRLDEYVTPGIQERLGQRPDIAEIRAKVAEAADRVAEAQREVDAFVEHASPADLGELYGPTAARLRENLRQAATHWQELRQGRTPEAALALDPDEYPGLPIADKRRVARAVIERIEVKRSERQVRGTPIADRVEIVWR